MVNVVQHSSVRVNLQQVLKLSVHEHGYIGDGSYSKFQAELYVSCLLVVESLTVSTPIGYTVKHEQGTIFAMSPISSVHHIALLFTPGSTGLKKTKVPQIISGCTVVNQLEGFIRVFLCSDNLSNGTQSKFLEAKGISGYISIEGSTVQKGHNQPVGNSVLKQVGNVKAGEVALHAEGPDFTANRRVASQLFTIVSLGRQGLEDGFNQTELTQMKEETDVPFNQSPCQSHSIQKQAGTVEMKFHLDFHAWYQYFARVRSEE